jgi:hypothetical protein
VWPNAAIEGLEFISDFFTVIYVNSCVILTLKAKICTFQNIRHESSSSSPYKKTSCPIYKSVTHQYIPLWECNIVQTLKNDIVIPYLQHRVNGFCLVLFWSWYFTESFVDHIYWARLRKPTFIGPPCDRQGAQASCTTNTL